MFDIDIERLMDLVDEENNASSDYRCKSKDLYKGDLEKLAERKKDLEYAYHCHERAEDAVRAIIEVFQLDKDQVNRLYIAGRAVKRWRDRTEWARLIPDTMQKQIERFIFGPPSAPSLLCSHCGCWKD